MSALSLPLAAFAGWALVAVLGSALAFGRLRMRRVEAGVRLALHELRRPLTAIALAPRPAAWGEQVELALAAVEDVEDALSGRQSVLRLQPYSVRPLVERAIERWASAAESRDQARGGIELRWQAGSASALIDGRRFSQALDNLIANAIEHGSSPVTVIALASEDSLRLIVRNPIASSERRPGGIVSGHGWGLGIVSAIAVAHGGRFLFDRSGGFATGTLELPLCGRASSGAQTEPAGAAAPLALAARLSKVLGGPIA